MVPADDLAALSEIESATSTRLAAQQHGIDGVAASELVYGVPHAAFINASFAYAKPRQPNRFNGTSRGAWYAARDVATCITEVTFHLNDFLAQSGRYYAVIEYAEMFASLAGEFVDLRVEPNHVALHPDPAIGYPAGNAIADAARAQGYNGIIYPSVRHPGGECYAVLFPHAVQSVAQGSLYRITWSGTREPSVLRVGE